MDRLCPRCQTTPCRAGLGLCRACYAAYKRDWDRNRREETRQETSPIVGETTPQSRTTIAVRGYKGEKGRKEDPPPAWTPYRGELPLDLPAWVPSFLLHYAVHGGKELAAAHAGIHRAKVYDLEQADDTFRSEVAAAQAFYRDLLEWESVNLARTARNPLPFFARLKAELPMRYIERSASLSITADLSPGSEADALELLRRMLEVMTPETHAKLQAKTALAFPVPAPPMALQRLPSGPEGEVTSP